MTAKILKFNGKIEDKVKEIFQRAESKMQRGPGEVKENKGKSSNLESNIKQNGVLKKENKENGMEQIFKGKISFPRTERQESPPRKGPNHLLTKSPSADPH